MPERVALPAPTLRELMKSPAVQGLLWVTAANSLFAMMSVSARLASRSASWATVGGSRAFVGALVALAVARWVGAPLRTKRRGLSWARSLLGTASMLATFYAISSPSISVGDAVTLFSTAPILIALLSRRMLGERPDRGLWVVLLVAFAGVVLVAGPRLSFAAAPAVSALLAAVFSALAMMFLRRMRTAHEGEEPESSEAIAFHFGAVAFVVHVIVGASSFRVPDPADVGWLVVTGVSGGVAQLAMTRAYAMTEAARLGAVGYLGTVMAVAAAILFLDERPSWTQLAGSALVVGAGAALAFATARASASRLPVAR